MRIDVHPPCHPVDEPVELRVTVTLDAPLRKGQTIGFALPESWSSLPYCITFTRELQWDDPSGAHHVAISAAGATFELSRGAVKLPSGALRGHVQRVTGRIVDGEVKAGGQVVFAFRNSRSTWLAENAALRVWIDGEEVAAKHVPRVRTIAGQSERLRVIVPSAAQIGEPVRVRVVSYDRFWNRSRSVHRDGVLRVADGTVLEEGIAFTGSYETHVCLPRAGVTYLYFDEVRSNPVRVAEGSVAPCGTWWGDLHSHDRLHNCGAGEDSIGYAREVSCLDFVAPLPDYKGLSLDTWPAFKERANNGDEPGRFTVFLAYEVGFGTGHHNVYFRGGEGPLLDPADDEKRGMEHLLPLLDTKQAFTVPHHVAVHWCPQDGYHAERDPWIPLIELYSSHGQGERYMPEHILAYEFNRVRGENKYASSVQRPVYVRDAWEQGRRFGVVASSDDHMGQPGKPTKGLTAVLAPANTRAALWDALRARRCYGTTGERMLLDFRVNGQPMGSELRVKRGQTLTIEAEVYGTDSLAFVEVAQRVPAADRATDEAAAPAGWRSASYDKLEDRNAFHEGGVDPALHHRVVFEHTFEGPTMYYLRVGQRSMIDGYPAFGWSSPIWVDEG